MSEDPNKWKLFLPRDNRGGIRPVLASFPISDRERSLLRALAGMGSRYELRVGEGLFIDGSRCEGEERFWPITSFVWPSGSPPAAMGAQTEEQLLRELTCGAAGLVVRDGPHGRSAILSELFPSEMKHVGRVFHLDTAHGVTPLRGVKRAERGSAPPSISRGSGGSEPPPAA